MITWVYVDKIVSGKVRRKIIVVTVYKHNPTNVWNSRSKTRDLDIDIVACK